MGSALFGSRYLADFGTFDVNMPRDEAKRITDKAIVENDVSTFVKIQNEYWIPHSNMNRGMTWYQIFDTLRTGGISGVRKKLEVERSQTNLLRLAHWQTLLEDRETKKRPVFVEAILSQLSSFPNLEKISVLDESMRKLPLNVSIEQMHMRIYDEQLRTGDALDRLWKVFVASGNADALCDWITKSMEPGIDGRGLEPILTGFISGDNSNPYFQRAMGLLRWTQGRFSEAEPLLRSAAMSLDDDPLGRFAWAEARREMQFSFDPEKLIGLISPDNPNFRTQEGRRLVYLARLFESSGDTNRAIESLEAAVKVNPWEREAWFRLATMRAAKNGSDPQAIAACERAEALESAETMIRKAHEAFRKGDRQAEKVVNAIVEVDDARFDTITATWRAIRKEPGSKIAESAPVPDLFFAARPNLIRIPRNPVDWIWLDSSEKSDSVPDKTPQGEIIFENVPVTDSGVRFAYSSFAEANLRVADVMGGGVTVFDYDNDGRLDLYFLQGCPFDAIGKTERAGGNRLFRNLGGWKFEDVTEKAGVAGHGYAMGAAVGDYDGDGRPDLFVTGYGNTILYRNRGDGSFEDMTSKAGVACDAWTTAAAFADLDGDGDQDLFAVTYVDAPLNGSENCLDDSGRPIHCSPGRFEAQPDKLWENLGDGVFRDISEASGIAAAQRGRGLGLAILDLDDDGQLDLFVANDASPNFFFRNEGKLKFQESAEEAGLAVDGSGRATASMGVVAQDLDGDGLADIFHTNFLNESNTFRRNLGGGLFQDTTLAMGLSASSLSRTGFGAIPADADLDGRIDLFMTNGHLDSQPWIGVSLAQKPLFYRGNGPKGFSLLPESAFEYLSKPVVGRGMAAGDFDDDGLVDLVVVHRDSPVSLLRNISKNAGRWIGFDVKGERGGPPPAGTSIELKTPVGAQVRFIAGGTGYLSHSDSRIVFGLGLAGNIEHATIKWPEKGEIRTRKIEGRELKSGEYNKVELRP
jgi:tetratricopeptide (TPR) repeat protein